MPKQNGDMWLYVALGQIGVGVAIEIFLYQTDGGMLKIINPFLHSVDSVRHTFFYSVQLTEVNAKV